MTTPIKTQCPHCHAFFNVPHTQLNRTDVKARCGRCQQVFLVNEHLIVSANHQQPDNDISASTAKQNQKNNEPELASPDPISITKIKKVSVTNKSHANDDNHKSSTSSPPPSNASKKEIEPELDANVLIYDDMEIDETPDAISDYGSLDEMEAWLTQLDASSIDNNDIATSTNDNHRNEPTSAPSQPAVAVTNTVVNPNTQADSITTPATIMSSVDANNIYADIEAPIGNHTSENAWLETLLQEENNATAHTTNSEPDDTDLSQLLSTIGMASDDQDKINQVRNDKIQAHMQTTSIRTQMPVATVLWSIGCLVLALLLFAQYIIFNVDTIVKNLEHAARLQAICATASCSLPHADITALSITKLTYRPSQVKAASAFSDIQADLVNQSTQAQLFPNLKVSIHGKNALIGEFIALPKNYLLSPQNQLGANSRKSVMFTVPVAANQIKQVTIDPIY